MSRLDTQQCENEFIALVEEYKQESKSRPEVIPISVDLEAIAEEDDKTAQLHELYRMINRLGRLECAFILLWPKRRALRRWRI